MWQILKCVTDKYTLKKLSKYGQFKVDTVILLTSNVSENYTTYIHLTIIRNPNTNDISVQKTRNIGFFTNFCE